MATQSEVAERKSDAVQTAQTTQRGRDLEATLRPPVDIFEDSEGLTLLADLPGVSKDHLNVRVERDNLIIEGEVQIEMHEQMQALYADVRSTRYQRRFALSNELNAEGIDASLKDGVLTVRIPKRSEFKPRRIEVKV